jgi:hypothetical protein
MPAMQAHPDRIVFIDETSVKTNLTRLRGRSLLGKRLEMDAPFGAWGTQTFIAGLTHDSLIAPWVIKGAPLMHVNMHCRAVDGWGRIRGLNPRCAGT